MDKIKSVLGLVIFILMMQVWNLAGKTNTDSASIFSKGHTFFMDEDTANTSLLIFLHGGVNNPDFKKNKSEISVDYLLEGNRDFLASAKSYQLDVLLPITDDSLNWLENHENVYAVLMDFISSKGKLYKSVYIGGFSDGGTGSYKIFYSHSNSFKGLLVINGFPQHKNFHKQVNYSQQNDKSIVFAGTKGDKLIPYEFLMTEYCQQKKSNANTYLYLIKGTHNFVNYNRKNCNEFLELLLGKSVNTSLEVIHGFVKEDRLREFYVYRKAVLRKYNWGQDIYFENRRQRRKYK